MYPTNTEIIELSDGIRIEAQFSSTQRTQPDEKIKETIAHIKPLLVNAIRPLVEVWREINQEMRIDQAEVEIGVGIEASGSFFIAQSTAKANLTVKLILKPDHAESVGNGAGT